MFIGGAIAVLLDKAFYLLNTNHMLPFCYFSSIIFIHQLIHYIIILDSNLIPGQNKLSATTVFR